MVELSVTDSSTVPWVRYHAAQTLDLAEKRKIKIRVTGPENELLDVTVPDGKAWKVSIHVTVEETDAV